MPTIRRIQADALIETKIWVTQAAKTVSRATKLTTGHIFIILSLERVDKTTVVVHDADTIARITGLGALHFLKQTLRTVRGTQRNAIAPTRVILKLHVVARHFEILPFSSYKPL
jgi:hypothetical protein